MNLAPFLFSGKHYGAIFALGIYSFSHDKIAIFYSVIQAKSCDCFVVFSIWCS